VITVFGSGAGKAGALSKRAPPSWWESRSNASGEMSLVEPDTYNLPPPTFHLPASPSRHDRVDNTSTDSAMIPATVILKQIQKISVWDDSDPIEHLRLVSICSVPYLP
jgi:hypothetical protein